MIIRCPYCEFSRSLNEQSIPSGAEFVTCPKCKHRFKFRSAEKKEEFFLEPHSPMPPIKKEEGHTDIWDAVDALHQKFEQQKKEHVTDVSVQSKTSKQEQLKKHDEAFEHSQQQIRKSHHSDHVVSPKKANKASQKQIKKLSGFSDILSSLPLFAGTDHSTKESVSNSNKAEQKKESIEQSKQVLQPEQEAKPSSPLLENKDSTLQDIKNSTCDKEFLPKEAANLQDSNKEHTSLLTKKDTSSKAKESSIKVKYGAIDSLEKESSVISVSSIHSSTAPIIADIEKEISAVTPAVEEIKEREQTSTMGSEASNLSNYVSTRELEQSTPIVSKNREHSEQTEDSTTPKDSNTFRPLFPHNNDEIPFELRLEQRLQLPPTPSNRPQKDLGRLDDIDINENAEPIYGAPIGGTLWESPISHGWCKSFLHTVRSVMFSAPSFFLKIPGNSGLSLAFLFFLIQGYITILCSIFWAYTAKDILDIPLLTLTHTNLPFLLLLAPLALGLILLFSAEVMRLLLELCGARNVPFPLVARILCYSTAPMVLSIIPFIGPFVGALWFFIAMVIAGKRVFSLSWFSSILFTLPATLSIVTGVLVFFL